MPYFYHKVLKYYKIFDAVSHKLLILELKAYSIGSRIRGWIAL